MPLPKKAIITVAGLGSRFLPLTKVIPKEMLPIIDRPILEYSVDELVASGVRDIIVVVRQGAKMSEDYFKPDRQLESQLKRAGKHDQARQLQALVRKAKITFVKQTAKMPYGNATPLRAAARLVAGGPFFYLFGDDLTIAREPVCWQLARVYASNRVAAAVIAVRKMPQKELSKYGVVKIKKGTKNILESIVEKPVAGQAPSDMAVFGRYILTPKILPIIKHLKKGKGGELWLTDALAELIKKEKVLVCPIRGQWLTTGDPLNYLKATLEFVWQKKELKRELRKYIVEKLKA